MVIGISFCMLIPYLSMGQPSRAFPVIRRESGSLRNRDNMQGIPD